MKVLIHLGFPKTGSSTLQFGLLKPLHDLGKLNLSTWRLNDSNECHDRRPSSCLFRRKVILDEYISFDEDKLNIISDESFTAPIRLRVNNYGDNIVNPIEFPELIKSQIQNKYGHDVEFEVLLTIRNQASQIFSQYVEEYNLKKYKNVDLIFDSDGNIDVSGFEIYKYNDYLIELERVFGKNNIHLTLFEEWKSNFNSFCEKLSAALNIDKEHIKNALQSNHVNGKEKNNDGYYTKDGSCFIRKLSHEQNNIIRNFFREDNLKLQERLKGQYDLYEWGYLNEA